MSPRAASRRLAAILFLDIVDSTRVAAELGDRRWRALLSSFRVIVRKELKRCHGHEESTAGDSFFATFGQPADGVRAAVAIVRGVQAIGLEIRCGLHFGECEIVEKQLGGIAVHIGARIMSLGGAGQVLLTATIRDLVTGTQVVTADAGIHELKGVPGSWQVWRLTSLDGDVLPAPADPEQARAAREAQPPAGPRRRRVIALAGSVVPGVAVIAVIAATLTGNLFATPRVNLLRIDPTTLRIITEVTDGYGDEHFTNALRLVNGALWQGVNKGFEGIIRRDVDTGEVQQEIDVHEEPSAAVFAFGSIWLSGLHGPGSIDRWDAVTGRSTKTLTLPATISFMDASERALWVLADSGRLFEIDPITNSVRATYDTQTEKPGVVVALGDSLWICDCEAHHLIEFDPAAGAVARRLTFAESGFLVGLVDTRGAKTLWLLDPGGGTLTPIDEQTGTAGQPIGVGENLHGATVAFGATWVVAGDRVLRVAGSGPGVTQRIDMPAGFSAGSIAADPATHSLWIADCGCPIQ